MTNKLLLSLMVLLLNISVALGNWGSWRGDQGNGASTSATPPTAWSVSKNVKWKIAVPGQGSGSPVIWGQKVFVVSAVTTDGGVPDSSPSSLRFVLHCYDRENGKLIWQETAHQATPHEGTHGTNGFSSGSPCTDGKHVYAHFGSRGTHCYTLDGEYVWSRQLGQMTMRSGFGEGSSPTLAGDKLIVPWDHEGQSYLYALDKKTGDNIWRAPRDEPSCWASPLVIEHAGRQQIIMNGQNFARAYDLASGEELWRCGGQTQRPVASAVAADGLVFVTSGFRGSFLGAFRPDGSGDIANSSSVVWTYSKDTPDIASPLLSGGRLYFYKAKKGILSCFDAATGEPHYTTKRTGLANIYASPVAAGGHVYLTDRNGKTVVIKDSSTYEVVAENSVGETVDATPSPVDNQLFIRGERHLFCIAE